MTNNLPGMPNSVGTYNPVTQSFIQKEREFTPSIGEDEEWHRTHTIPDPDSKKIPDEEIFTPSIGEDEEYQKNLTAASDLDSLSYEDVFTPSIGEDEEWHRTHTIPDNRTDMEKITQALENENFKGGILEDKAECIVECCKEYNVDPCFALAVMSHETGWGKDGAVLEYNNPGGVMKYSNANDFVPYDSVEEGIKSTVRNLRETYFDQGLRTIQEIGDEYAPINAENDTLGTNPDWIPDVTWFYNEFSGRNITKDDIIQ